MDRQLLEDSVRIIEENMGNKDFNIDMWCREIAVGRTRLGTKIKGITGLTLNDFILQIKLRKCASLLESSDPDNLRDYLESRLLEPGIYGEMF